MQSIKARVMAGALPSVFPVLISQSDVDLKLTSNGGKVASANGADLVFTAGDGLTKLNHELESYDPVAGKVVAWVSVTLASGADTKIYVYFGNSAAASQSTSATWDTNFKAVYHLKETSLGGGAVLSDSSGNGHNLTIAAGSGAATMSSVSGKAGGGIQFTGGNQYNGFKAATAGASGADVNNTTIEGWFYVNSFWPTDGNAMTFFGVEAPGYGAEWNFLRVDYQSVAPTSVTLGGGIGAEREAVTSTGTVLTGGWHHAAMTRNATGGVVSLYLDGVLKGTKTMTYGMGVDGPFQLNCVYWRVRGRDIR